MISNINTLYCLTKEFHLFEGLFIQNSKKCQMSINYLFYAVDLEQ